MCGRISSSRDAPLRSRPARPRDTRDALTVGFTPELAAGVWVGNSDGHAMDDVTGVRGAAPIWKRFMETALDGRPARAWIRPPDIVVQEVDALSGLLPSPFTPADAIREEVFLAATVPTQRDPIHQPFLIHTPTGAAGHPRYPGRPDRGARVRAAASRG